MIIYIYGSDTFRSREYLKDQVAKFKTTRDPQGYNTVFLDASKEDAGRILSEMTAAPFLSEKRMVVLENVLLNKDKGLLGELIARVKSKKIPESNVVVFWQGEEMGKTKECKELDELLAKERFAYKFEPLSEAETRSWIGSEMKKRGATINNFALNFLAQNIGGDMWRLNTMVDQLVSYKKSGEIELADAQLFLEEKVDDSIFSLVDAIVNGNKKVAFKLLAEQRRIGAEEFQIFGMIVWQFRMLISIRDLIDREDNLTSDELAKRLGMKPYPVRKSLPIAKRYPLTRLKEIYQDLLDIDIKTKTGLGEPELLLDVFVGKV